MVRGQSWGYSVEAFDNFLLVLFSEYSKLLKTEFCNDFNEIMASEDFGPMTVNTPTDYDNVLNISWFKDPIPDRE